MRAILLLPLALLGTACGAAGDPPNVQDPAPTNSAYDAVVGAEDRKEPVRIRSGGRFAVRLTDNPSIGEEWRVVAVPPNLRAEGFLYQGEPSQVAGADTQKLFRFVATAPGRGTLRLVLDYRGEPQRDLEFEVITD